MVQRALALLVLAGLVLACGSRDGAEGTAPPQEKTPPAAAPSVLDERLLDREWRLESFGAMGEERPLLGTTTITLRFNDDRTLDGFAGCNTYRTTYRTGAAGELAVRALVRTNQECSDGVTRQETTYLDVLHRVESYEVSQDRLLLFYEGGSRDLVYRGAASADEDEPAGEPTPPDSGAEGSRRTPSS
jgi:heat shock protein HslJ